MARHKQFTIRGLIAVTAIIGAVLALCVHFPNQIPLFIEIGGFALGVVALAIYYIRTDSRPPELLRVAESGTFGFIVLVWAMCVYVAANIVRSQFGF